MYCQWEWKTGISTFENNSSIFFKKLNILLLSFLQTFHSWLFTPEKREHNSTQRLFVYNKCVHMLRIHFFVITKKWKQQMSFKNKWINKFWYVHTMAHCPVMKRNELLIQAKTWMNLKPTMQTQRSQTRKRTYDMIPLI